MSKYECFECGFNAQQRNCKKKNNNLRKYFHLFLKRQNLLYLSIHQNSYFFIISFYQTFFQQLLELLEF